MSKLRAEVDQSLTELAALFERMDFVLAAERQALENHDLTALTEATEEKQAVCESLAEPKFTHALVEQIGKLEPQDRSECELAHKNIMSRARSIRDFNLVNGKVINRSQNVVREMINVLSGRDASGLYGESGQPAANGPKSGAIAKA